MCFAHARSAFLHIVENNVRFAKAKRTTKAWTNRSLKFEASGLDETHVFHKTCVSSRPDDHKSVYKSVPQDFRRLASTKRTFSERRAFRRDQTAIFSKLSRVRAFGLGETHVF